VLHFQAESDVFTDAQPWKEGGVLEDESAIGARSGDLGAAADDAAAGYLFQS
jgi:hypothetical protein